MSGHRAGGVEFKNAPGIGLSTECRCQLAAAMELEPTLMIEERLRLDREGLHSLFQQGWF